MRYLIPAILFILSAGLYFNKKFKDNSIVVSIAGAMALIATAFTIVQFVDFITGNGAGTQQSLQPVIIAAIIMAGGSVVGAIVGTIIRTRMSVEGFDEGIAIGYIKIFLKALNYLKRVFKVRVKNVPLDDFPVLFFMQAHVGFCGIFFASLWFMTATIYISNIWANGGTKLLLMVGGISMSFFLLSWVSSWFAIHFSNVLQELRHDTVHREVLQSKLEIQVRVGMVVLISSYVITLAALIWLTGGVDSPFIPFYVVVFALTISKCNLPYPGNVVLAYFLIAIMVAFFGASYLGSFIPSSDLARIQDSSFQYAMRGVFILASLIAPTISAYLIKYRLQREAQSRSPNFSPHN